MAAPTTNEKKKVSSNSSYIPDDISFSILAKLPAKSLKRFCCVRKSWSLLFQNPNFINMFRNNLISKSHPLFDDSCIFANHYLSSSYNWNVYLLSGDKFENKIKLDLPSFHIPNFGYEPHVLGSAINGILCIYNLVEVTHSLLWNPATNEVKVIPPGFAEVKRECSTRISLHGFGYDNVRHDYKVIRHVNYYTRNRFSYHFINLDSFWEIYELKSNSWRKINFDMPTIALTHNCDVYFDGVCHWWGVTNTLVSFNLCNEEYFITPPPLDLEHITSYNFDFFKGGYDFDIKLTLLNGCVAIITNKRLATTFQVSILGEFGVKESWIKLFDVQQMSCTIYPLGVGKKGNIFFKTKDGELVCLDLITGLIEEIDLKINKYYRCEVVIYKRNLQPIGEINN
jgi:molecular chaperone HtpG